MRTDLTFASPPLRNSSNSKLRRRPHLLRYQAQRRRRAQSPGAGNSFATSNCLRNRQQHLTTRMPLGCRHGWGHRLTQDYEFLRNKINRMEWMNWRFATICHYLHSKTQTSQVLFKPCTAQERARVAFGFKQFWQCCRFPITLSYSQSSPHDRDPLRFIWTTPGPLGWGLLAKSALLAWKPWGGSWGSQGRPWRECRNGKPPRH